jgi:hypothetical protein
MSGTRGLLFIPGTLLIACFNYWNIGHFSSCVRPTSRRIRTTTAVSKRPYPDMGDFYTKNDHFYQDRLGTNAQKSSGTKKTDGF